MQEEENVEPQVEEETPVEEETTPTEDYSSDDEGEIPEPEPEDAIQLSRADYNRLKRKAIAYDSVKQTAKKAPVQTEDKDERFERLELRTEGYSKEEIDEIMALGGTKVLNSKLVQSAIKALRAENKSRDAKEPLNSKSPVFKKFTQDDLSKMSAKDMEKILRE